MINDAYNRGRTAALARFKLGNMQQGAAGYNPMLSGQAATGTPPQPGTSMAPPASAAPPMATGASKAHALG
jgi:hypothetical protein